MESSEISVVPVVPDCAFRYSFGETPVRPRKTRAKYGALTGNVPGFAVKVADTNGAGDTFFGAVLSRIVKRGGIDALSDAELADIVRFANKAASITTSRSRAMPAMPTLDEVPL